MQIGVDAWQCTLVLCFYRKQTAKRNLNETKENKYMMNKLPTVKSILNTPSIFEGFTFEDMVTVGRVNAEQATSTCMINAQKDYMQNHGWADMKNIEGFLNKWSKLESQVRRKFEEAQEIASIL